MNNRRCLLSLIAIGILLMLSGCANVEAWERGTLAKPQMSLDPNPLQSSVRSHNYSSRESGASDNAGGGGGGCGCY